MTCLWRIGFPQQRQLVNSISSNTIGGKTVTFSWPPDENPPQDVWIHPTGDCGTDRASKLFLRTWPQASRIKMRRKQIEWIHRTLSTQRCTSMQVYSLCFWGRQSVCPISSMKRNVHLPPFPLKFNCEELLLLPLDRWYFFWNDSDLTVSQQDTFLLWCVIIVCPFVPPQSWQNNYVLHTSVRDSKTEQLIGASRWSCRVHVHVVLLRFFSSNVLTVRWLHCKVGKLLVNSYRIVRISNILLSIAHSESKYSSILLCSFFYIARIDTAALSANWFVSFILSAWRTQ